MYLIVIEAESNVGGPVPNTYHYQPYRLAVSVDEAKELMLDYMRLGPDSGALVPQYFALYKERDVDAIEWLQETGRA